MKYPAFGLSLHSLPRRNGLSLWLPPYRVSFSSPSFHVCFSKEPSLKKTNLRAHGGLDMRLGLGRVGRVRAGWVPAYVVGTATAVEEAYKKFGPFHFFQFLEHAARRAHWCHTSRAVLGRRTPDHTSGTPSQISGTPDQQLNCRCGAT